MGDGVAWDLLAQYPNAGQAFSQSFQQGMQNNQQMAGRNALSAYATNPSDQQAFGQAFAADPRTAMALMGAQQQQQQQAQAQQQAQVKQWHSYAGQLAKWADTPEKWDQGIDYLLQSNHPDISTQALMALKGKFDPALRQSFMALGGVQENPDQNQVVVTPQPNSPAFIYDKSTGKTKEIFAPNDGSQTPGAPAGPVTATNPKTGAKVQLNPQTGQWEPMNGGQTPPASGGFPQR